MARSTCRRDDAADGVLSNLYDTPWTCAQADKLDGFSCAAAEVQHHYKQKHLRTAFTQLPGGKDTSSTVSSKVSHDAWPSFKLNHESLMSYLCSSSFLWLYHMAGHAPYWQ